ncbi:MBL fold metallo-hydrolase [Chloroflexi bacterium TSY]|nr:MBL fold metallo-hydrolase [Chloroflexi bacterium TSY]
MSEANTDRTIQVHRIFAGRFSNAFLIESETGLVLIDAGPPRFEQQILDKLTELGRTDLRLIFITHAHIDHYGGASKIRAETGAPIAVHHLDADALAKGETRLGSIRLLPRRITDLILPTIERSARIRPTEADILVEDGNRLDEYGLDAYVIHLPGHTPGSAGVIVENQLAFVSDLISTVGGPHLQRAYADNWEQLTESVNRLKEVSSEIIYTGHGTNPLTLEELHILAE